MGIQKTKLDNKKIEKILREEYNLEMSNIEKLDRGTSNLFKIESGKNKYILKEFISKRNKETIMKEVNIINFLKERCINVPNYVKTVSGNYYTENEGRMIILQNFIDGYIIDNNTGDYQKVIECARILGKLTKELMYYPELSEENIIEEYFSKNRVILGIEKLEKLKNNINDRNIYRKQIENDLNYRIKILKEIENNFNFDIIDKFTIINSHGDFCSQQLIYNDKVEPTIIDFEKAKRLPIVWEVIRSYSYIDKDSKNGDINVNTLVDYFNEFSKYILLNKYDLKYVSYLYLLQLASSTFGYEEYNEDYNQKELLNFAFFRTNLCKSLYEKAEEISFNLSKKIIHKI